MQLGFKRRRVKTQSVTKRQRIRDTGKPKPRIFKRFGRGESLGHGFRKAARKEHPVAGGAVIVFSCRDIAAASGKVNRLQAGVGLFHHAPCQPRKIRRDGSFAILAHRVGRITKERRQSLPGAFQRDHGHVRINYPRFALPKLRIAGCAASVKPDPALGIERPPVAGNILNRDSRGTNLVHGFQIPNGNLGRSGHSCHRYGMKVGKANRTF